MDEIDKYNIHIYEFPDCDSDEDEEFKQQDRELKVCWTVPLMGQGPVSTNKKHYLKRRQINLVYLLPW